MNQAAKIIALDFPEPFTHGYARLGVIDEFDANPIAWSFDSGDDDQEILAWLTLNAPGWRLSIKPGPVETLEIPVGCEPELALQSYQLTIHFASAHHRDAWRARQAKILKDYDRLKQHIEKQKAIAPPGVETCCECGTHMRPFQKMENSRIAQFAFRYEVHGQECSACGLLSTPNDGLKSCNILIESHDAIIERVGLPDFENPLWTETIREEWKRRRKATPEITIDITPDMTCENLVANLDAAIAKTGRPARLSTPNLSIIDEKTT